MLVYGDGERSDDPRAVLAAIAGRLRAAASEAGVLRHAELVGALIEAGGVAQGLADRAFSARGEVDGPDMPADAAFALTRALARLVIASWNSGFAAEHDEREWQPVLDALDVLSLPASVTVRQPEGFAFYALYPEAYAAAARQLPTDRPVIVVGLRSVGTVLAAIVAEALPDVPAAFTVRPHGHPFDRRLAITEEFAAALKHDGARYVIVDEGPGLSGSSVAAAIRLVERHAGRDAPIHILPGHAGKPGPQANEQVHAAWSRTQRHAVSFDELVLNAAEPAHRLDGWCANLTGPLQEPIGEISGGWWRPHLYAREAEWPPVHAGQESRKFLAHTGRGTFLLRFAGLGAIGERKLAMAQKLHAAGFVPEPLGLRHGFLVERWLGDVLPFDAARDRDMLLGTLGEYLAFRARSFPVEPGSGASLAALHAMLLHNTRDLLTAKAHAVWEGWRPKLQALQRLVRPVAIDGRLHAWEWLRDGDRLLKTDALDHNCGHDLVGCQDIAWDVAGAAIEHNLSHGDLVALASRLAVPDDLLRFLLPCYAAFQYGAFTMAEAAAGNEAERARLATHKERSASALRRLAEDPSTSR